MTTASFTLQDLVEKRDCFLIISHLRPDGDAYGSSLGLGLILQALGKEVQIVNQDGLLPQFNFLPGSQLLQQTPVLPPDNDPVIIAVDTSDLARLGPRFQSWQRVPDVNIDHHISNPGYAPLNLVDPVAPATAQVLYDLVSALHWPISSDAAANLYVGLMTDTGSFRYRQTTAHTLDVGARLVEHGADPTDLAQHCYQSFKSSRLRLLREMLNATHFADEDRIAWFILTPELLARSGATTDETEGLLEYLQMVESVEAAFVLEIMPDGFTRASLRSRGRIDVQRVCALFGGGGHRLAAGLRTRQSPDQILPSVLQALQEQL